MSALPISTVSFVICYLAKAICFLVCKASCFLLVYFFGVLFAGFPAVCCLICSYDFYSQICRVLYFSCLLLVFFCVGGVSCGVEFPLSVFCFPFVFSLRLFCHKGACILRLSGCFVSESFLGYDLFSGVRFFS